MLILLFAILGQVRLTIPARMHLVPTIVSLNYLDLGTCPQMRKLSTADDVIPRFRCPLLEFITDERTVHQNIPGTITDSKPQMVMNGTPQLELLFPDTAAHTRPPTPQTTKPPTQMTLGIPEIIGTTTARISQSHEKQQIELRPLD